MGDDRTTDQELDRLQWTTSLYYLHETNPDNGLVQDKADPATPSSIAAVGLALASLPVVVERGVVCRPFAAKIARRRLRYLHDLPQGPESDAAGYKGFFYHFLDIETGRRVWQCELSTIDSEFLFAGMLTAATYLDRDGLAEAELSDGSGHGVHGRVVGPGVVVIRANVAEGPLFNQHDTKLLEMLLTLFVWPSAPPLPRRSRVGMNLFPTMNSSSHARHLPLSAAS